MLHVRLLYVTWIGLNMATFVVICRWILQGTWGKFIRFVETSWMWRISCSLRRFIHLSFRIFFQRGHSSWCWTLQGEISWCFQHGFIRCLLRSLGRLSNLTTRIQLYRLKPPGSDTVVKVKSELWVFQDQIQAHCHAGCLSFPNCIHFFRNSLVR